MPYYTDSEDDYVLMPVRSHAGSEYRGRRRTTRVVERVVEPEEVVINNHLVVPGGSRPRAASTGGGQAPMTINIAASDRGHSRSRSRHRHDSCSSGSDHYSARSRSRHRRRPESKVYEDDLAYSLRKELDLARERRDEDRQKRDREEERRRWQREEEDKIRQKEREKEAREEERKRWQREEEDKKRQREKEREAILLEAKLEEERKKKAAEELRQKILKDEEEKQRKEKEKKKAEEEEFERKVKEKFMNAGYSPEYIEEILHKKKQEKANKALAIDLQRPTYIKVNRKYLHPDTLDYYGLPWEWDSRDTEYIIIKKYIDNTFQDELFEHTRRLKERKLITGPYVKETKTITTLTPNDHSYVKKGDKMYVVREKSKSPSRSRRSSWMFT
ncbi:hypothetical protein PV08_08892 [Exophiala spinifera]|uniref:Uncharacterized protein n=1 Tax=Exophiala spinifera TaxID=91928 RepID=A0A0D1YF44_9EURO|nr:uncharacterized protein PV08_08892 [Exophiala spinifera]KIW13701.1 hypothetical protein PV08_08892 [Exophiala spinifera]